MAEFSEIRQYENSAKNSERIPSLCESFHGNINWDVAKRFLYILYTKGKLNKTNLAMKMGVNYDTCKRYILWTTEIGWIEEDDGWIVLSDIGLFLCSRIFGNP
jgi:hypothetical protein